MAAAALALVDLFAHGLSATFAHVLLGLGVFAAVRVCIGFALAPYHPPLPDDSETRT